MEATLPDDVYLPKGIYLEEGDWFEIYNFKLRPSFALIRTTRSKYNIKFTDTTVLTKIEPIIASNFLCLANFSSVLKGLLHPMYSIDLCGAIVAVGELQQIGDLGPGEIYSYQTTRMEFYLVNIGLKHIKCVAYGKEAVTLNNYYRTSTAKVDLCVLRSWSIVWGEGGFNYVTNLEGGSQILFDHDMAEIQNFKSKIPTTEL
ncbi:uncharacterized protein LOC103860229 [Brassica rapa]|uniref:uncharacterized protein LOC103860229 n=1 Tax=Brassica campestris TaxID=3711 RepID=UPI00142E8780|nr:uncharacterized protein LOC103860229 [Brassica rapa]